MIMRKRSTSTLWVFALALAVLAAGCVGRSKPPRFYVLTARAAPSLEAAQEPQVVVGPIKMPEYLNRPQIVTRLENGQLEVDESNRWAQPLAPNLHQVLADNIAALTGSQRVVPALTVQVSSGYRVVGVVSRFEADESGLVALEVTWAVRPIRESGAERPVQRSLYTEPSSMDDPGTRVEAMDRVLLRWSEEIVAALQAGTPRRSTR
jgi:uncharacterized lipoprotein YmbA